MIFLCLLPHQKKKKKKTRVKRSALLLETGGRRLLLAPILMENNFFLTRISERQKNTKPGVSVNFKIMLAGVTFIKDTFLLYVFKSTTYFTLTTKFALIVPCLNVTDCFCMWGRGGGKEVGMSSSDYLLFIATMISSNILNFSSPQSIC